MFRVLIKPVRRLLYAAAKGHNSLNQRPRRQSHQQPHRRPHRRPDPWLLPQHLRHHLSSLAFQLRYGTAILVGLSLLLVSSALSYLSVQAHFQEVLQVQQARSQAAASEVGAYAYELQRKLGYLSRVQGFTDLSEESQAAFLDGLTRQNEAYEAIAVLDSAGQPRVMVTPYGFNLAAHANDTANAFTRAFRHGEDFIGPVRSTLSSAGTSADVSTGQADGAPVVAMAVPIHNQQDEVSGVLLAYVNLHFLWTLLDQMQIGQTGYVYVVDNRNVVIAQQHQATYSLEQLSRQPLIQRLRQQTGTRHLADTPHPKSIYRGLHHQMVFGAVTQVPGVHWRTVIEMPLGEAISSSLRLLLLLGIALPLSVMIAIATGVIFSRKALKPLQQLTRAALQLSSGDLTVQVPLSRVPELGLLGKSFNRMAIQLRTLIEDLQRSKFAAENALIKLKHAQAQLVQNEKLSSLGQMVAGIAHEINNPVTFIHGNIDCLEDYAQDLIETVELYQHCYPEPLPQIHAQLESIEFDYVKTDVTQTLKSMTEGTSRIRDIVQSLRVFSRLDESAVKDVDLHEGLDSTLVILKSRLQNPGCGSPVEVIKHYGQLPQITCHAGQLNQVFMNILANAIDALVDFYTLTPGLSPDSPPQSTPPSLPKATPDSPPDSSPQITITTRMAGKTQVQIVIADNGPGIAPKVQQRLFDPFFTTKPVGQGTGLGLSISHQVVSETHGGSLTCQSKLGEGSSFVITLPIAIHQSNPTTRA